MGGTFVDTTVVIGSSDSVQGAPSHKSYLQHNPPSSAPAYALREMLAGYLQNLCSVHNFLIGSNGEMGAALASLARLPSVVGRKKHAMLDIFAERLKSAERKASTFSGAVREMADDLALQIESAWQEANSGRYFTVVQPLGCFEGGSFSFGPSGVIIPPNGRFNCDPGERCSAAGYLFDREADVSTMIECLSPKVLAKELADKGENASRRAALKDLKANKPKGFSKKRCRAIGDAYFVGMCPVGATIVTTNGSDFEILCNALSRSLKVL